jgi:hypothetical protein
VSCIAISSRIISLEMRPDLDKSYPRVLFAGFGVANIEGSRYVPRRRDEIERPGKRSDVWMLGSTMSRWFGLLTR